MKKFKQYLIGIILVQSIGLGTDIRNHLVHPIMNMEGIMNIHITTYPGTIRL